MSKTPIPLDLDHLRKFYSSHGPKSLTDKYGQALIAEVSRHRSLLCEMEARAPLQPPLVWSKEKPKVAGLYWHRNGESRGSCSVYMAVSGFLAHFNGASRPAFVSEIEGEWAGPIPSPTEGPTV